MFFLFIRRGIAAILLSLSILQAFSINLSAMGRRSAGHRKAATTVPIVNSGESCEGWRGKITYTQNINEERNNDKGQFGYEKHLRVVQVDAEVAAGGNGSGVVNITQMTKDVTDTEDRRRADCGGGLGPTRPNTFVEKYFNVFESSGRATGSTPVTVHMSEGGNWYLDISLPPARGRQTMQGKHSQKGYCTSSADNEENSVPLDQEKEFESIRIYAEGKTDPRNASVLKGTAHYDPDITVTWDLAKVAGECDDGGLTMSDLKLEQHVFPNKTAWQELSGNTVDGNQVRITASVSNGSKKPKSGTVTIKENKSGTVLATRSVSVAPGAQTKVEFVWDTNGWAWTDAGAKASDREIEASVADDTLRQEVSVVPKPVVLVHGLWSSAEAWSNYQAYLDTYNDEWKAFPVGADPAHGRMNTGVMGTWAASNSIFQNAQELGKQVKFAQESMNAWHVDLVAHSMGGLISRFYIHSFMPSDSPDSRPYVSHLVMLGTPNEGSPCADIADGLLDLAGHPVEALRQLKPSVVAELNRQITNRKGVKFSILVGVRFARTCGFDSTGDGVVPVTSAEWQIGDRGYVPRIHTALTGQQDFELFVKPHLAVGPKQATGPQTAANNTGLDTRVRSELLASISPDGSMLPDRAAETKISVAKNVVLNAGQTTNIPFSSSPGVRNGVTFIASPNVAATLINSDGETIEKIEAGSPEASEPFKTFELGGGGNLTLRLENTSDRTETAYVSGWTNVNTMNVDVAGLEKQPDGLVRLQARVANISGVLKGAAVMAKFGQQPEIMLLDDGKHGDGESGDGIYGGAATARTADPQLLITIKATANGMTASAATVLELRDK